jgi:hypothetical protein
MSNLSKKILEKLDKEKIKPTPKSEFQVKEYLTWLGFGMLLFLVVLSISVILHIIMNDDWEFYAQLNNSLPGHLMHTFPYLWAILFLAGLCLALYEFRKTKNGYKKSTFSLVLLSIFGSTLLGAALFYIGIGKKIHYAAANSMPMYESITPLREKRWISAEKGFLGGEIIKVRDNSTFILKDAMGNEWEVDTTNLSFKEKFIIKEGNKIRMYGLKTGNYSFEAKMAYGWNETRSTQEIPIPGQFDLYVVELDSI